MTNQINIVKSESSKREKKEYSHANTMKGKSVRERPHTSRHSVDACG
jgi:hypothetical protein